MYCELVFSCGCISKGRKTTSLCVVHNKPVIAATSTKKRTRQTYVGKDDVIAELCPIKGSASELFLESFDKQSKAFKYDVVLVPDNFPSDKSKNILRYNEVRPRHIDDKRVAVVGLRSIKILKYLLNKVSSLHVHTESPLLFRIVKSPDIIDTMTISGSGKFNGKNKAA